MARCSDGSARRGLRFAVKPRESIRIVAAKEQGGSLMRHVAIQLRVASPIDLAHPPVAEQGGDFIDAETGAGSESQE